VKNDYGTDKEARALNGLQEPLKKNEMERNIVETLIHIRMVLGLDTGHVID
jgi:hypothetical protein